jgi:hypothetical protein
MTQRRSSKRSPRRKQRSGSASKSPITNLKFSEILIPSIVGAVAAVQDLYILPTNFPWLATTARTFSKYQLKKISITFIPAGFSTYTGQVVGAFTYDAFETPPSTFAQVAQTAAHRIQTVHRRQTWTLDCSKTTNRIYPVVDNVPFLTIPTSGRVPYLPAFFHLCNNSPNTQMLGSLQITYSVDFTAPLFLTSSLSFNMIGNNLLSHSDDDEGLTLNGPTIDTLRVPEPLTTFQASDIRHPSPELLE